MAGCLLFSSLKIEPWVIAVFIIYEATEGYMKPSIFKQKSSLLPVVNYLKIDGTIWPPANKGFLERVLCSVFVLWWETQKHKATRHVGIVLIPFGRQKSLGSCIEKVKDLLNPSKYYKPLPISFQWKQIYFPNGMPKWRTKSFSKQQRDFQMRKKWRLLPLFVQVTSLRCK